MDCEILAKVYLYKDQSEIYGVVCSRSKLGIINDCLVATECSAVSLDVVFA